MKKRICLLLAILIFCFSVALFAHATQEEYYADEEIAVYIEDAEEDDSEGGFSVVRLLASIVGGYAIGFIVIWSIASKNKSVYMQRNATEYTRPGSFAITGSSDSFLYKKVDKIAKPKRDDKK